MFVLSIVVFVLAAFLSIGIMMAERHIVRLSTIVFQECEWPSVSVIVCARNEQASIRDAVTTHLELDYPNYDLFVVNDRSNDRTGEILAELQREHPRLKVVTIEQLPNGWLGKCNAMHVGAMASGGEWILFTDADVSFESDTLKRALGYALREQADHLTLAPSCVMPNWILHAFVATFSVFFKLLVKPAEIANPKSKAHAGVGAFNLIRSDVYRKIGGHASIRLRPDDDLKLGKIVKTSGYSQRFASGIGLIRVPWYSTVWELVRGLEKNSFAGMDYRLSKLLLSNVALPLVFVVPFIAIFFAHGAAFWLFMISCALILAMAIQNARSLEYPWGYGLFFPFGVLMFLFIIDRAVVLTYWNDGIYWRGNFYSLRDLKANRV
jgi:glycosyltransferase involved in cell wall biosynthesis